MSTIKVTNVSHPSAASPAIVLDADSDATYAGTHDFSAATVTGAPQGLVHINTTTFSAVSSVSLDNVFTSDYDNYSIVCTFTGSTGINPRIRLRASSTDTTSGYFSRTFLFGSSTNSTYETTFFAIGDARTTTNGFTAQILAPNLASNSVLMSHHTDSNGSSVAIDLQSGSLPNTTQYDGFTFFPNTGTVTGTIRVYGYSNGA